MYQSHPPSPELEPFVECYWSWQTSELGPGENLIFPDVSPELLIHIGKPPLVRIGSSEWELQDSPKIIILARRPLQLQLQGPMHVIGIRFRPWGLQRFCRPYAVLNTDVQHDVLGRFPADFDEIRDRLTAHSEFKRQAEILNSTLLALAGETHPLDQYIRRLDKLAGCGLTSSNDMAELMDQPARSFSRFWKASVNVPMRTFIRIMRFQEALALIRGGLSLAEIAAEAKYADQAHMNREIKSICGLTPTSLRQYLTGKTFEQFYVERPESLWRSEPQ